MKSADSLAVSCVERRKINYINKPTSIIVCIMKIGGYKYYRSVYVRHRLNMELDPHSPCAQLYSLAEALQPPPHPPRIWAHTRGRNWVSQDRRHLFVTRVSSQQTKVNFSSNRNKPTQDLFRICFGLFCETK
jgi:hypothetical protein